MSRRLNSLLFTAVCLLSVGFATYLLVQKPNCGLKAGSLICDINETFSCSDVNCSPYSEVLGIPITVPAIALYLTILFLLMRAYRKEDKTADGLIALAAVGTVVASITMATISKVYIGKWCLFCMFLYGTSAATLALAWLRSDSFGKSLTAGLVALTKLPTGAAGLSLGFFLVVSGVAQVGYVLTAQAVSAEQAAKQSNKPKAPSEPNLEDDPELMAAVIKEFQVRWLAQPPTNMQVSSADAVRGPSTAPVTIIEYADYECPYCQQFNPMIKEVIAGYGNQVRFIFRHYPLDLSCNSKLSRAMHEHACDAARAAECARRQGRFWDLQDSLFTGRNLTDRGLLGKAKEVGVDTAQWQACYDDPATQDWLTASVDRARELGLKGTPSVFVNGRNTEPDPMVLKAAIDAALMEARGETLTPPTDPHGSAPTAPTQDGTAPAGSDPAPAPAKAPPADAAKPAGQ